MSISKDQYCQLLNDIKNSVYYNKFNTPSQKWRKTQKEYTLIKNNDTSYSIKPSLDISNSFLELQSRNDVQQSEKDAEKNAFNAFFKSKLINSKNDATYGQTNPYGVIFSLNNAQKVENIGLLNQKNGSDYTTWLKPKSGENQESCS